MKYKTRSLWTEPCRAKPRPASPNCLVRSALLTTVYNLMVTEIMDGSSCASRLEGDGFKSEPRDQQSRLLPYRLMLRGYLKNGHDCSKTLHAYDAAANDWRGSCHNIQPKYTHSTDRNNTSKSDRIHLLKWIQSTCFGDASSPYVNRLNEYIAFKNWGKKTHLCISGYPLSVFLLFWSPYM